MMETCIFLEGVRSWLFGRFTHKSIVLCVNFYLWIYKGIKWKFQQLSQWFYDLSLGLHYKANTDNLGFKYLKQQVTFAYWVYIDISAKETNTYFKLTWYTLEYWQHIRHESNILVFLHIYINTLVFVCIYTCIYVLVYLSVYMCRYVWI